MGLLRDEHGKPLTLYHGTNRTFDIFDPSRGNEYGIYLTPRYGYASRYGDNVVSVYVDVSHPLYVENKGEITPKDLTRSDVEKLIAKGYDAIVSVKPGEPISKATEIVLFNADQIRGVSRQNPLPRSVKNIGTKRAPIMTQSRRRKNPLYDPQKAFRRKQIEQYKEMAAAATRSAHSAKINGKLTGPWSAAYYRQIARHYHRIVMRLKRGDVDPFGIKRR